MHGGEKIEMIVMTKSSKYGEYCVAGFDCATGRWIRLVSDNIQTHGALSDEMLYDAARGYCAGVLDRVMVDVKQPCPGRVQTENMLVDGRGRIHILGRATLSQALRMHPCEEREALFSSRSHIVQVDVNTLGHSLEIVRARNVRIYTQIGSNGKAKYKIDFECGGHSYSRLAMTDPKYYDRQEHRIEQAAVVLSISDDEWSRENGHYIYAAKIFDVLRKETDDRPNIQRRTGWIATGAIVLGLAAAGIVMTSAPKVYVPPYSGARYHLCEDCTRLVNLSEAYRLPEPIAKLLYRPCTECMDGSINTLEE